MPFLPNPTKFRAIPTRGSVANLTGCPPYSSHLKLPFCRLLPVPFPIRPFGDLALCSVQYLVAQLAVSGAPTLASILAIFTGWPLAELGCSFLALKKRFTTRRGIFRQFVGENFWNAVKRMDLFGFVGSQLDFLKDGSARFGAIGAFPFFHIKAIRKGK